MRKHSYLSKGICLVIAIALASSALVACGDESDTPLQPAAATGTTRTAEPTSAPRAVPTPTTTAISTPTPTPTPAASAEPVAGTSLATDCLPGGVLDNVATISSCAEQAIQQVKSFSFEGEFNLLALFSGPGARPGPEGRGARPEGLMRLSGDIVQPDRLRFEISFAPEDEMIQITAVVIGTDIYMRDPESEMWFKGTPPESEFLSVVQMVGMLQLPRDSGATLNESITLDDGAKGYAISYDLTSQQSGMEVLGFPGGKLVMVVGADDFLTREVRVAMENVNDETPNLLTIRYRGYNEPKEIEPPAQYVTLPEEPMDSGTMGPAAVVRLAKNEDGDVEVTFNKPIHVQGQVELYVLDPTTGGWGLPLLGGSGTAILTFDADAEDRPPLVPGKSQIDGFIFPTPGSQMTDAGGARLDLTLDKWTYR